MSAKLFFKIAASLLSAVLGLIPTALGLGAGFGSPTVRFDAANTTGAVSSLASGYLYGVAQDGVPSYNMTKSLRVSSVSAKTQGGLQHPIGQVGDVANQLLQNDCCDYIVVYLQDMFATWYYEDEKITQLKKQGRYDWESFVKNEFFPLVKDTVEQMQNQAYTDKLVYCLYNECDNGVWFGDLVTDGTNSWHDFNENGRGNFYAAWKMTYDYVKSLAPNALIGGPGYYEYNSFKMRDFLAYTSQNDCNPDVIIYHELSDRSIYDWQANVDDLRALEREFSVDESTPIIVTEYGRMQDNSNPNTMLKYIIRTQDSGVYSNQAYWLFANNLCSTCADYNTPNSAWWVYRWYANMQGETMKSEVSDILHSDLEKAFKQGREPRYQRFLAMGTISEEKDRLEFLVSGGGYDGRIAVDNLRQTALYGKRVKIEISAVTFQGVLSKVYEPETVKVYTRLCPATLNIPMELDENTAYRVTVSLCEDRVCYENKNLFVRYEAEDSTLLGDAYTYRSAYATTGGEQGMVGGIEKSGDGAQLKIKAPADGMYQLRIIYGNSNDGTTPADRTYSHALLTVDERDEHTLLLENTIRSEITNAYDLELYLEKGSHTLRFEHLKGTYVLDSILLRAAEEHSELYCERDSHEKDAFLAVSDRDGYFELKGASGASFDIDGAGGKTDESGSSVVYLRRGLNYITMPGAEKISLCRTDKAAKSVTLLPRDAELTAAAEVKYNEAAKTEYITGISCDSGSAKYTVSVDEGGVYKLTMLYSGNRENGVHAYNVDLVEDFVTISVNGVKSQNLYCRNTYSSDTFVTVTTNIELKAGENVIELSNDGAVKFNGGTTYAPDISQITINQPCG